MLLLCVFNFFIKDCIVSIRIAIDIMCQMMFCVSVTIRFSVVPTGDSFSLVSLHKRYLASRSFCINHQTSFEYINTRDAD